MTVTVLGIFVAPVLEIVDMHIIQVILGLVALLYLGYAVALAGHYELFSRGKKRSMVWWPRQEKIAMLHVVIIVTLYLVGAMCIQ
jgi:hypothetical protein